MLYNIRFVHKVSQLCGSCGRAQFSHHSLHKGGPNASEWGHGIAGDDCTGYEPQYSQADLPSSVVELGDTGAVARMLRSAKLIGKGERLRDIRRERHGDDCKLVCFLPHGSINHAIVIGEKPAQPPGSDVVGEYHEGIYRVRWCRNGYCYVTSSVNGGLLGAYVDGKWDDKGRLPEYVHTFCMKFAPTAPQAQETAP